MQRHTITARNNWQQKVETLGFGFHSTDIPYWNESACYSFTAAEIDRIETATMELYEMSLKAVQYVIDKKLYPSFGIPEWIVPYVEDSWNNDEPAIYGRMDLCVKDSQIKLLEFNADTPTSLFEAGIVQWFWLQDYDKSKDQFNSIHEKLIAYWKYLRPYLNEGRLYFSCVTESLEDLTNTEYMRDCAIQGGIDTRFLYIEDLGWNEREQKFTDLEENPIANIFKLYPWEWLLTDEFGKHIGQDTAKTKWIEPAWKMILSNKAILVILWDLFPWHPLLLKSSFSANEFVSFAKKPLLSREGGNITLVQQGKMLDTTDGIYGKEGYMFQDLCLLPELDGRHPVIGTWIIGQEPAGMGIRESSGVITGNTSHFVPHYIE